MASRSGPVAERRTLKLRVARARPSDVDTATARVSPLAMRDLGLSSGDLVEVLGRRRTAAFVMPLPLEDRGLDVIRLDGLLRVNAGAVIGEEVTVAPLAAADASLVKLSVPQHLEPPSREILRRRLEGKVVGAGDLISLSTPDEPLPALGSPRLHVLATDPGGLVRIGAASRLEIVDEAADDSLEGRSSCTYDDLGGLGQAIREIREIVELPLTHPELFRELGITPPRGVLIHGPPGTGKTLLARAVAGESNAHFLYVAGPEIVGPQLGESERRLRELFREASARSPSIIFIDEIDSIAAKRDAWRGDAERRIVAQLLMLMDGLEPRGNVIVLAATNSPDLLDEALRRPGRFDREIPVAAPDAEGRREILRIQTRGVPLADDVNLEELAGTTFGFVGADIAALVREAALDALRRVTPARQSSGERLAERSVRLEVTSDDFRSARRRVQPSALRELVIQTPVVRWEDIGGLEDAKRALRDGIELQVTNSSAFRRLGIRPAKGFLLFGPPGTGKTLLAKAVAHEAAAHFLIARCTDIVSKWFGESERQIARLFARARQAAPAIIFFDEIDALAPHRGANAGDPTVTERIVNTLLAEMDGLQELHGVVVIAATNRPSLLDPALLRPGRFDELIYVAIPDRAGRLHILRALTGAMPLANDVDLDALSEETEGFTGADLEGLVRRAGLRAIRERSDALETNMAHFEAALRESHPSVTPDIEREYEALLRDLKRESARDPRRIGFVQDR
ncbi:MAG TPA: CDC48 family AAA ATPase [Gemmatimonadaceae bacterium]|nr:CDC48 family AAA ATPase [Gemmatimonadaceae bacterium]